MAFYALLATTTAVICFLGILLWLRTRNVGFLVGIFFLYFWSLWGAWFLVHDLRGGISVMHYQYLFERMFPIVLDRDYFYALSLYGLFVTVVLVTVLYCVRAPAVSHSQSRPIAVSHTILVTLGAVCAVGGFLIVRPYLVAAAALNLSGYSFVAAASREGFPLYTIARLLIHVALMAVTLGLVVYASGHAASVAGGVKRWGALLGYAAVFVPTSGLAFLMGNKNELFVSLITAALFYIRNVARPRWHLLVAVGLCGVLMLGTIEVLRGLPLSQLSGATAAARLAGAAYALSSSNEAFGAHFSMYGALHFNLPVTYGSSFVSLLASAVPRALWATRPATIYQYYAHGVGVVDNLEYTIHHATAWYLNFGLFGIIAGAILLGWLWAWLYRQQTSMRAHWSAARRTFSAVAFPSFCAGLPVLIRAGPEVYKGMIIEFMLLPAVVLMIATLRIQISPQRQPVGEGASAT